MTRPPRPAAAEGGGLMEETKELKLGRVGEEGRGLPRPCPCPGSEVSGLDSDSDSDTSGTGLPGAVKSNCGPTKPRPRPRPPPPPLEVEKGIRDCLVALEKLASVLRLISQKNDQWVVPLLKNKNNKETNVKTI